MVLCIIAFFVFSVLSLFSAKYRPLAKKGFDCVFRTVTLKPCDSGLDDEIKTQLVGSLLNISPFAARILNKNFVLFSWIFVLLSLFSFFYMVYGFYNFYKYGNCDGTEAKTACILNDLTGDYGRFSEPSQLIKPNNFNGIVSGNQSSDLIIVEFGCFTCPYTKKAEPVLEQIVSEYNVRYVFKPFPLPNHNNSKEAALAVLCANKQGKQMEFRKEIFRNQETCSADGLIAIKDVAKAASLDMEKFNNCFDNNQTSDELDTYIIDGKNSHIYATPTFFINDKTIVGPKTLDQFRCIINQKDDLLIRLNCYLIGAGY